MPDIDLEPGNYRRKNAREPILLKGWWKGILLFVGVVLLGMYAVPPVHSFFGDVLTALGWE
jgi:hypothetical protein